MEEAKQVIKKEEVSKRYIWWLTFVAALGGFLFGYDSAVISGAISGLKDHFELNDFWEGWAVANAVIGAAVGAAVAGYFSSKIGRKLTLIIAAFLFGISAVGSAIPEDFTIYIVFRMLGGAAIGIASMVAPIYISEIAPSFMRGKLVSMYQFAIVVGIFIVYFVNYFIKEQGRGAEWEAEVGWRLMLGSETIPAAIFFILLFFIPESPRWQVLKNKMSKAKSTLDKLVGDVNSNKLLEDIKLSIQLEGSKSSVSGSRTSFSPIMIMVIIIGVCMSVFQQVSGINAVIYYAPNVFENLGFSGDTAMLQAVLVGMVNMLATIIAIMCVDKWGRKPLIYTGCTGMAICLTVVGFFAYLDIVAWWAVIFVLGYIAFFALSLGAIVWVLLSEIFPNKIRSVAMSIAVAAQWLANYAVSQTFPMIRDFLSGALPFWIFAGFCVITIIFTKLLLPETKGTSLEEMEDIWEKKLSKK